VGPSGVGKGLLARCIHAWSERSGGFVTLKGGQLVETLFHTQLFGNRKGAFTGADRNLLGAFELAENGSLFLDELPDWGPREQAAILGAVDDGDHELRPLGTERSMQATCRIIVGSIRGLDDLVSDGVLREDLRQRFGDFVIVIPPLCGRRVDILHLAFHFLDLERSASPTDIPLALDADVILRMVAYHWPGNARQVKNAVALACESARGSDRIEVAHLPPYLQEQPTTRLRLDPELAAFALMQANGHRRKAARMFGVHPNTIDYQRKRFAPSQRGLPTPSREVTSLQ
jgi:DNA-binding NtrC family response regulator